MIRTKSQNKRLYALLSQLKISEDNKKELVYRFTNGRTERSSEMEYRECNNLIMTLQEQLKELKNKQSAERQYSGIEQGLRREIFKLMYDVGFINNRDDNSRKLFVINAWIKKKMKLKKQLNELSVDELNKMIKQLRTVRRIYNEKAQFQAKYN
ncbi:MAG: hypothetical protein L3J56_06325 [Bacteroidales bacterium]|nr:hypothetical protein [Bacteroidales bacterium]